MIQTFQRQYQGHSAFVTVAGETIESTLLHPFWVVRGEGLAERPSRSHVTQVPPGATTPGRWVDAGDLRAGDELLLRQGESAIVEAVRIEPFQNIVYNFQVAELECYSVGRVGVLVHNVPNGDETEGAGSEENQPQRRTGSGKNEPHGRAAGEQIEEQLKKAQEDLEALKRNQGSRRAKAQLERKIKNLKEEIRKLPKGETHGRRGKTNR